MSDIVEFKDEIVIKSNILSGLLESYIQDKYINAGNTIDEKDIFVKAYRSLGPIVALGD